jgi:hypothetical protein
MSKPGEISDLRLRLRQRESASVTLSIPVDTLAALAEVAAHHIGGGANGDPPRNSG